MMKKYLSTKDACLLACEIAELIAPYCERVEPAGSLRRCKPQVGDIEIVCQPVLYTTDLFGEEQKSVLFRQLRIWLAEGLFENRPDKNGRPAVGERFARLLYRNYPIDLFSVIPPAQWGVIFAIRTGSAEFSRKLVTQHRWGGYMPDGWQVQEGQLWDGQGNRVLCPEENDFFAALGIEWKHPAFRD